MSFRFLGVSVVSAASLAAMIASCSATPDTNPDGEGGAGGESSNSSTGPGGGFTTDAGIGPPVTCSADLQNIVDEKGNVVETCPPDQGCFGGQCIPACEAAANAKGSIGCDYFAPDPPFYQNGPGAGTYAGTCYAVFIANTWGRHAKINVVRDNQAFDVNIFGRIPKGVGANTTYLPIPPQGLPPNEVAVLFLSHKPGAKHDFGTSLECPVQPALTADAAIHGSGRGSAFRVTLDTPVTAYDILPYGGAQSYLPSASLLLPWATWGTNYYTVAPHPQGNGALWALVVGAVNGTTLKVLPKNTLPGGGALGQAPAGQTTEFTINSGEMVQWIGADPTSTIFQSDQPIGVFSGTTYLSVATATSPSGGARDSAHQQSLPIGALGSEYVGGNLVTRLASLAPESVLYRLLGVVDGTTLEWDPGPPPGAPTTLAAGQVADFETSNLFSIRSQDGDHPFAMTQYMPGASDLGSRPGCNAMYANNCRLGDEEWVFTLPPKQFLQHYVFFTDPTFATTNLVITRVKDANGFSDVSVECLGKISGWMPVGTGGQFEVAHVDLIRAGTPVTPACNTSRHEATSKGAFGVTVWGTDYYSSYGYPAGGNVGMINTVVVPPVPK
ncbi:MAG: IgGFc-binding protein [Polyangiaceae bacterium]|nr:IgGFc-binding protein [Polyangiaceae bacterium]